MKLKFFLLSLCILSNLVHTLVVFFSFFLSSLCRLPLSAASLFPPPHNNPPKSQCSSESEASLPSGRN